MSVNEVGAKEFLNGQKWPVGLQNCLIKGLQRVPIRFFIVDDSGSMMANDGNVFVKDSNDKYKTIICTRWKELITAVKFHVTLSHAAGVESEFRLLNGPSVLVSTVNPNGYRQVIDLLDGSPSGGTPLCQHIREITSKIKLVESQLRANGQKACIIIATDGESSDGDIATALKPLQALPVWLVVRLCTNEDRIVDYWNNIDKELEIDMDVLNDLKGEAEEIEKVNPWFTYSEPIHRLREFGTSLKTIDLLDESKYSADQIHQMATLLFPESGPFTHPDIKFNDFMKELMRAQKKYPLVFDPVSGKMFPLMRGDKIASSLGKSGCVVM